MDTKSERCKKVREIMRSKLSKYEGKFVKIKAIVGISSWGKDFGCGEHIKTLCLENVQIHEVMYCHVWVKCSNHFLEANLKLGDKIEFTAQVVQYRTPSKIDWGFATIRNVRRIEIPVLLPVSA